MAVFLRKTKKTCKIFSLLPSLRYTSQLLMASSREEEVLVCAPGVGWSEDPGPQMESDWKFA